MPTFATHDIDLLVTPRATLHPAEGRPVPYRVVGDLAGADRLMRDALFLGTYPGIDDARRSYVIEVLTGFLRSR